MVMKISNRNYPILEKLEKGSLGNMPVFETDLPFFKLFGDTFKSNFNFYQKNFKSDINIISQSFSSAAFNAADKLLPLFGDIMKNDLADFEVNGTFIMGDTVHMVSYLTKKGSEDMEVAFFSFNKDGVPLSFFIDSAKYNIYQNGWLSKSISDGDDDDTIYLKIYEKLIIVINLSMFKSFADVETIELTSNQKKTVDKKKYINQTNINVTFLDSKWFTNLVKSDSFNVRGHFRLQPKKKNGEWTRELIWISEFEKKGYNLTAKIIRNYGKTN